MLLDRREWAFHSWSDCRHGKNGCATQNSAWPGCPPHTPTWLAIKFARELEVIELVTISFRPSVPAEVRRYADELIIAHIPQLTLGQKLSLAKMGPGRIVAELLAGGEARIARACLDNGYLTEAHLLRALANHKCAAEALTIVAGHSKWSNLATVRAALICHANVAREQILALLPRLSQGELDRLSALPEMRSNVRDAIRIESEMRLKKQSHLDTPTTRT